MEGFIGSSVCRGVRSCWARRGICNDGYQQLPRAAPTTTPGRGTRLRRRTVLGSATWRLGRLRRGRRASAPRWLSPLQLLNRILDTYITSMLSEPLKILRAGVPPAPAGRGGRLRRDASPGSSSRRRDAAGGRGVMLNICVAEVLLRRTTSEVRRSPLQQQQQPTKDARRSSVRA
ncbi:unnamed protein product [Miscanthus lutarioriparius]|uniref:Uncharacterized protein n=1 Tax=Miscanthus lutarioriparius TaxID=422564 RepID=A0A811PES5_9POAL|nr:unnamed protein product [Miscanthus lutarioriparius]